MTRRVTGKNEAPEVAGIYCRMSLAVMGDATKVEDQARICRNLARARGWHVPEEFIYIDNNRSAWQKNRKRKEWDRMLRDIDAGRFKNLVVYHGDRLVRHPADLEKLLDLADRGGMTITSPGGRRNLDIGSDRTMMRVEAAFAWQASDDTSRRKKSGFERMRIDGRSPVPGGHTGRGFGYKRDGTTLVPAEAAAIREAAARLLGGEAITVICQDLTKRGIRSTSEKPLGYATLRRILTRPRIAGLLRDGTPGKWEPILDRETWEMTCGVLRARAEGGPRGGPAKYLLSGIARCAECNAGMQRVTNGRKPAYGCVTPDCLKVHRNMFYLDEYVITRTLAKLSDPRNPEPAALANPLVAEIAQLEARRAEVRGQAERLAEEPGADLDMLAAAVASFGRRIAELRGRLAQGAAQRMVDDHTGLTRAQWDALPLATRRALVAACFRITVLPASKRGPGFRTEDVQLTKP